MEEEEEVKSGLSMLQHRRGEGRRARGDECRAKSKTIKAYGLSTFAVGVLEFAGEAEHSVSAEG